MKIAILGAAGKIGGLTVSEAVAAGHVVHALARNPDRIPRPNLPGSVSRLKGDVLDRAAVGLALEGVDAVICTFGAPLNWNTIAREPTLCEHATRVILDAMADADVSRLVCMTAIGVGDSRNRGRLFFRSLIRPLLLARIFADRERQERLVRASTTTWSIVRPAELTDEPPGPWRMVDASDRSVAEPSTIPRATVARFLVEEATANRFVGRSPILTRDTAPNTQAQGVAA